MGCVSAHIFMHEYAAESIDIGMFFKACVCLFVCDQLENGVSHRESKRSLPHASNISGHVESSAHTAERNFVTETTHNG